MSKSFSADAFLRQFWKMDKALVAQGFPATSVWWKAEITRFLHALARGARRWVIRAGRRAGKSTTLCRLAVAWAWFGTWHVPTGDTAMVPFISISKDESAGRLRTIAAIAKALGLEHEQRGEEIELIGERHVFFKTFAATTSAVVGFTSIAVFGDEVARWEARDTAANPAREVLGSLTPTLATQAHGFAVLCSSPWSVDDYHAELFALGDNEHQATSFAPTWVANPTISEERTHELEPDQRTWQREYGAEPGATVTAALDAEDVAACFGRSFFPERSNSFCSIDASSLRGDAFTWMAGNASRDGVLGVRSVGGWEGAELRSVSMETVVCDVAGVAKRFGTSRVFGDQREEAALSALFVQQSIHLKTFAWSEPSKDTAMQLLRRLMRERRVMLVEHETLRRELVTMKARLMPSGRIRYETNGLDYASALVTLAHAMVEGDFVLGGDGSQVPVVTRANPSVLGFDQPANPFRRDYTRVDYFTRQPIPGVRRRRGPF